MRAVRWFTLCSVVSMVVSLALNACWLRADDKPVKSASEATTADPKSDEYYELMKLFVDSFERKAAAAVTADDYWAIIREVVSEFGFPHVRLFLEGRLFEHCTVADDVDLCCAMRIPLSDSGYVNFRYPAGASVRHAVAITSIVAILQRSIAERSAALPTAARVIPDQPPSSVEVARSWGTVR